MANLLTFGIVLFNRTNSSLNFYFSWLSEYIILYDMFQDFVFFSHQIFVPLPTSNANPEPFPPGAFRVS